MDFDSFQAITEVLLDSLLSLIDVFAEKGFTTSEITSIIHHYLAVLTLPEYNYGDDLD